MLTIDLVRDDMNRGLSRSLKVREKVPKRGPGGQGDRAVDDRKIPARKRR